MSHTSGPWHLEISDRKFIVKEERTGNPVAVINDMHAGNIALVLAAPDFLEAAEDIIAVAERDGEVKLGSLESLKASVAKAKAVTT